MMPGGLKEENLRCAYYYLNNACYGYDYLINEFGAKYYEKTFEEAKELLNNPIFDEFRNEDDDETEEDE